MEQIEDTPIKGLEQKENDAKEAGDINKANDFAEQRERALRLYQKADSVRNLFDTKRYEGAGKRACQTAQGANRLV